jgi:hypothetical protein
MAATIELHVYSSVGVKQAIITDVLSVTSKRVVNDIDTIAIKVADTSSAISYLVYGAIIEYYRTDVENGIATYRENVGIIRYIRAVQLADTTYDIIAFGFNVLLADRIVAYKSGLNNLSQFTAQPAETILKTLFNYNVGSNATTANGRYLDGRLTGASTSATSGAGSSLSVSCSNQNLLLTMQKIQLNGGGDFAIIFTAPTTYTFTWYTNQLGTDRTATIFFSISNGSLGSLSVENNRANDITATIVGGQGEGSARIITTRPATLPTGLDLRERFIDARNENTTAQYQAVGDGALRDALINRQVITAQILQSANLRYARDYNFGDIVTIVTPVGNVPRKIQSVVIENKSTGEEVIQIELASN